MRPPLLAPICAFLLLSACASTPRQDPKTISPTTTDKPVEGRPTFAEPVVIPGQRTVLVPFSVESDKSLFADRDPYTRGGVLAGGMTMSVAYRPWPGSAGISVRWHNVVFRHLNTGAEWPLLSQRGIITEYHALTIYEPHLDPAKPPVARALAFIAVLEDTNRDGRLNDLDARVAILTDADGRNPRIVTPRHAQVWSLRYQPTLDAVFLQVAEDTTGDGRFTFDDVATPYFVSLHPEAEDAAQPLLTEQVQNAVRSLLSTPSAGASQPPGR